MWSDDEEVTAVGPGENVKIKLKGIEEDDVSPGFVLCDNANPIKTGRVFDAQVRETVGRILQIGKYLLLVPCWNSNSLMFKHYFLCIALL
jgi:translation elongation factor EF-1alpha